MASPSPTAPAARVPLNQIAGFIGIVVLGLNALFFVLSSSYFRERGVTEPGVDPAVVLAHTRIAFAVFTGSVGLAGIAAAFSPRAIGHILAGLFGLTALVAGVGSVMRGMPGALSGSMLVLGVLVPLLTVRSLGADRASWSFLTVICGVLGLCLLFGAPKVRTLFGIGLWSAMIIPGLLAVTTIALAMLRGNYQTTSADAATADSASA